ncbi:hypothetical protein D3C81_1479350 [compost metagenome]
MCRRLGKKHHQYVGPEGLERQKYEKSHWNPKRRLCDTYMVRILNDHTFLRDVFWNPQCNDPQGISKPLTRRKAKLYAKLENYYDRAATGK